MPTSTGDYECHFKIKDTEGNYYQTGNSDNIWIKIKVVANTLTAFVNANPKELILGDPLTLIVNIQEGNPPYELTVNWGDGNVDYKEFSSEGDYYLHHTYSQIGKYTITAELIDKAGKIYSATYNINVSDTPNLITNWTGKLTQIFDIVKEEEVNITTVEKTTNDGNKYYQYELRIIPSAEVYYKEFILPVPPHILDLNQGNIKLTFVMRNGELKYYDRKMRISTDQKKFAVVPINIGYYNEVQDPSTYGKLIIKDLQTGQKYEEYRQELSDNFGKEALNRYTLEISNDSLTVYRYENNYDKKLFTKYELIGNYITEINLNFKGNGKLLAAVLEYDEDKDGTYDKKLILNTADKTVDWSKFATGIGNNPPTINSFTADKTTANVGDTITFSYDVSDPNGDTLTCEFDFDGDGNVDKTINNCSMGSEVFTYTTKGTYTAKLTVSDGKIVVSKNYFIKIKNNTTSFLETPQLDDEHIMDTYNRSYVHIRWNRINNATSYEIELSNKADFSNSMRFSYKPEKLTPY